MSNPIDVVAQIDQEVEATLVRKVREAQAKLDEWRRITGRTPAKPVLLSRQEGKE
jgi:hypothetical protein